MRIMSSTNALHIGMIWRLRRIAKGWRLSDLAPRAGITATRLSQIEHGEVEPSQLDRELLERVLPPLPRGQVLCETDQVPDLKIRP